MRLWNLSHISMLETPVITEHVTEEPAKRPFVRGQYRSSPVKTAVQVMAFAVLSYGVLVNGSSHTTTIPQPASPAICNIDFERTPLESLFSKRFGDEWTEAVENKLLSAAAEKSSVSDDQDLVNLIHSSLQESLPGGSMSSDVPRLSQSEIQKLIRRRA